MPRVRARPRGDGGVGICGTTMPGASRNRSGGGAGRAGRPSHPRAPRRSPHAARQRSSRDSASSTTLRPVRRRPSAATSIESIRSARCGSRSTSSSASARHGGRSSIASRIAVSTRSGLRRKRPVRVRCASFGPRSRGQSSGNANGGRPDASRSGARTNPRASSCVQPANARRSSLTTATIARPSGPSAARASVDIAAR